MPDRTTPPIAASFQHRALPAYKQSQLSNGIPVYLLQYGSVEVMEVQVVFRAGKNYQPASGIAIFAAQNMQEATTSHTSLELAQKLDGYGAWIDAQAEEEALTISLATLSDKIPHTLPLLREVVTQPAFHEKDFERLKQQSLQKKTIAAQQKRTQARRHFFRLLFGENHPYGSFFGVPELAAIHLQDIHTYFQQFLQIGNMQLIVTGKFDEEKVFAELEAVFGTLTLQPYLQRTFSPVEPNFQPGRHLFKEEGMQSSLRLGHPGMKRKHPDYHKMLVVNTILGGYFGSRLMRNIREEKGYTYGIYSAWMAQQHEGFFVVQSDVGNEYVEPTIKEVRKEIQVLIDQGVQEEELQLVKNYMLGQSISQRETPFQLGDILRFSVMNDISFAEMDKKFAVINALQAGEVSSLAATYFRPDNLLEVVVGEVG